MKMNQVRGNCGHRNRCPTSEPYHHCPLEEDLDDGGWGDEFPPIWERYLADFNTNESHSFVLQNGTLTGPDGALLWSASPFRGVRTSSLKEEQQLIQMIPVSALQYGFQICQMVLLFQ